MSQTDRKYDGPTIQEKRLEAPPSPPPNRYRGVRPGDKKRSKGPVSVADLHSWGRDKDSRLWWSRWGKPRYCPYVGYLNGSYRTGVGQHVIRRLRAVLYEDKMFGVVWLEDQSTGEQISPEFSSRGGLLNWLEYEGLGRGYLEVERSIHKRWNKEAKEYKDYSYTRLKETVR